MKENLRTLYADLDHRNSVVVEKNVSVATFGEKLGGFAAAVDYIEKQLQNNPSIDAYESSNPICLDIGFLTSDRGVSTGYRTIISGLSPMITSLSGANGVTYSAASGRFGPMIRSNNFDSIRISGKLDSPSYIVIEGDEIKIEDANDLIGKTTSEKIEMLSDVYEKSSFAVIGPAAESGVRFSSVAFSTNDQLRKGSKHMRFAGRGGYGALFASKNLYGIVVRQNGSIQEIEGFDVKDLNKTLAKGEGTKKYREKGTFHGNLETMFEAGLIIHDNFSHNNDERTKELFRGYLEGHGYKRKDKGCMGCGIRCWKEWSKENGKAIPLGKIDFEPGILLGPNLGIYKLDEIMQLINICDETGMDAISAGVSIGYELEKEDKFGDFDYINNLINNISEGKHDLKEGVFRYAGMKNDKRAMQVKGSELPAYFGNLNPGYAFSFAGGDHMKIDTYNRAWNAMANNTVEEWIENILRGPKIMLPDFTGLCKFAKLPHGFEDLVNLYKGVYGEDITETQLKNISIQTYLKVRDIDFRQGFTENDDYLPGRCFEELGPRNPVNPNYNKPREIGHFLTKENFERIKQGVYEGFENLRNKV